MIQRLLARIWSPQRPAQPDPYGIEASLALRKQQRLAGYARPYRRRG